jgi:hypothetical protein
MSWGEEATSPDPDWTISARLANVVRGDEELPEVTNLQEALEAWGRLDEDLQRSAVLILERPITIDGAQIDRFEGDGIVALAERLST